MSSLKDICSGLPLDPMPPARERDDTVPHAPNRTHNLTDEEQRVSTYITKMFNHESITKNVYVNN